MTEKKHTKKSPTKGFYNKVGAATQELHQIEEAVRNYDKLILLKPDYAEAYFNRGIALLQLKQLEEAIRSYNKAVQLKPDYAEAYNNRGIALQELGRLEKAIESYDKAIQLNPDYEGTYHNQGIAFRELGRLEKAIESCNKAIQLNPDYAEAYYNRGIALQELGRLEKAIESYDKAIQLNPDYAEVYVSCGIALQELGRLEKAIESCNKAIQLNPDSYPAQHILNSLLGSASQSAPREYVESLFDRYAHNFEHNLINKLGYKTPFLFKETLCSLNLTNKKFNQAIDLGCGTGLVGVEFRNIVNTLTGIDLSEKMIQKAEEKKVYNNLIVDDLVDGLQALETSFDLFISADVFVYLGDLRPLFKSVSEHANNKSLFMFSTEDMAGDSFCLQKTCRFAHSKNYILSTASDFGFQLEYFERHNLRKNKGKWLAGGIYILTSI